MQYSLHSLFLIPYLSINKIISLIIFQMNNSPNKISSLLNHDFQDNFANKYLSDSIQEHRPELIKEHLETQVNSINATLASLFSERPRLGLLFSSDPYEIQKTIDVIKLLLSQRQRDIESKNEVYANMRKIQGQKSQIAVSFEKVQRELKRVDAERQNLLNKLKNLQKSFKDSVQRLTSEKDEWTKKFKAIEARQNQYINASRKQDQTIKSLQDKIGRGQDKGGFKNTFDVMQQLQTYGPTFVMVNGEHEYNQMVAKTMQENYTQISNENQFLKDTLQNIQKQLQTVLDLKCQILRRRRGYDSEFDSAFELTPLKPQLLNMPQSFTRQPVSTLHDNVSRFKEAMRAGQSIDDKEADQKVACVSNVKNLIKNYKNVIESQEQLLGRVILKAKEFKSIQIQAIQSRNSKAMDEDQIERARRFIQEQSSYLQGKNKQLELTRKAMQTTMRKVEQEREEWVRRSGQAGEEIQRVKRQIEQLPAMVQQQLNNL